jgi:hypothetical protein
MSLPSTTYQTSYHSAASWLSRQLSRDTVQATAAAFGTKAVGSYYRVKDDKDAPDSIRKSTIKRESLLLGMTLALTPIVEHAFNKHVVSNLQKVVNIAPFRKLMMLPPIMLTLATAEAIVRLIYPKPHRNYLTNSTDNQSVNQRGRTIMITTAPSAYQFKGAPAHKPSPFKGQSLAAKTVNSSFMKDMNKFAALDTFSFSKRSN